MKSKMKTVISAGLAAAFVTGNVAHAGVIVDLFTDPLVGQQVQATSTGTTVSNQIGDYPSTILGGYRDLSITKNFEQFGDGGAATLRTTSGTLLLDNATGVTSTGVVTWDGSNFAGAGGTSVNTTGLGGVNLTSGGADSFLAQVKYADLGFDYKIKLWDMGGSGVTLSAAVQFAIPLGSPIYDSFYSFDWFQLADGTYCDGVLAATCADPLTQLLFTINRSGDGGAIDFTDIGAMQLVLSNDTTHASADFALGKIETVPEPGSLALLGLGLAGLAALRRRKVF